MLSTGNKIRAQAFALTLVERRILPQTPLLSPGNFKIIFRIEAQC